MSLTIHHVALQYVHQTWPLVESYIAEAQKYGGDDYTLDQIKVYVAQGQWILLVAADEEGKLHGAATVNFINMPNDRVALKTFIGGRLVSKRDTFAQVRNVLKSFV